MRDLIDKIRNWRFDIKVFFIVVILIINFILVFKPDILKNKSSYASIKTKKSMLNSTNKNIVDEIDNNNTKTMKVGELREKDGEFEKRALVNKKEIDVNGLKFHLPSILIRLEDSARANGLDLAITYSEISYQNLEGEDIHLEGQNTLEELDLDGEENKPLEDSSTDDQDDLEQIEESYLEQDLSTKLNLIQNEDGEETEEEEEKNQGISLELKEDVEAEEEKRREEELRIQQEKDNRSNVEVTKIPIKVKGKYAGVRGFINDLDRLNYIEPTKIDMDSDGDNVEATIIISVFHGDIFE